MADDYIELFLKWTRSADTQVARQWLERRGLAVIPMKAGALLSGTKSQIEQVFAVCLNNIKPPAKLPVPSELSKHVEAVTLPEPRSYHV